ncbi:hypothetical protein Trydic_g5760 [Trypoxylus dichotomus]
MFGIVEQIIRNSNWRGKLPGCGGEFIVVAKQGSKPATSEKRIIRGEGIQLNCDPGNISSLYQFVIKFILNLLINVACAKTDVTSPKLLMNI